MKYLVIAIFLIGFAGCSEKAKNTDKLAQLINENYSVSIYPRHGWSIAVNKDFLSETIWCRDKKTLDTAIDCIDKKIRCLERCCPETLGNK